MPDRTASGGGAAPILLPGFAYRTRCIIANRLVAIGLRILPEGRGKAELTAMFAAYRAGVEAAVFMDAMERLVIFKGDAGPDDLVSDVTAIKTGQAPWQRPKGG